jgi:hypothetical protein
MDAIERENPQLKDVLPKGYGRPTLDLSRLGRLVDVVTDGSIRNPYSRQTVDATRQPGNDARHALAAARRTRCLNALDTQTLLGEDRVYGGGLHKLEPKELANLPIGSLTDALGMRMERWVQPTLG